MPPDEPGQPGQAEPAHRVRVGVAGRQEPQRGDVGQVTAEGRMPGRSQQLEIAIQPGQDDVAALDQAGAQPGRAAQRIGWAQALGSVQALGVQQRQPGQDPGIEPVGLGVLGVVVAQVGGLLGRNHDYRGAAAAEPGGQRHPRVAGGLHHHGQRDWLRDLLPQPVQIGGRGLEPAAGPGKPAALIGQAGLVRSPAGRIDPQCHQHVQAPSAATSPNAGEPGSARRQHRTFANRDPASAGHRVLNRAWPSSAAPLPAS